ncbi:protein of unknown function [Sinomicrobium oceani]|uniref:DUF4249 domain-containing protein n=1 Tax=Sinomicrobium oceani TaxID=1150368 RepID=A0A1K1PFH3_9FLAO|nr:DUF4249 domain-containing protein [Sinomicrobium oceani]SFW46538.1 protein of unknown function [Sinomicrobium oceani]
MKRFLFSILIISILLMSCEDTIKADLDTADPRLVIDAGITWVKGTSGSEQVIKLSTTTGYYDTEIPVVSGATVYMTNGEEQVFDFVETPGTGNYVCNNFIPVIGEEYRLTVIADGITYEATERMISVPEISSVEQNEEGGFLGDEKEVKFYYQDDPEADNYYLTRFDVSFLATSEYDVSDDSFTQGNRMFENFSHEDMKTGDVVNIRFSGISERFYNYMSLVIDASDGNSFSVPAANIRGNIRNQADEQDYPYGFFRLSQAEIISVTIE